MTDLNYLKGKISDEELAYVNELALHNKEVSMDLVVEKRELSFKEKKIEAFEEYSNQVMKYINAVKDGSSKEVIQNERKMLIDCKAKAFLAEELFLESGNSDFKFIFEGNDKIELLQLKYPSGKLITSTMVDIPLEARSSENLMKSYALAKYFELDFEDLFK